MHDNTLDDLGLTEQADSLQHIILRYRVWIFSAIFLIITLGMLWATFIWWQDGRNQNAALHYNSFIKLEQRSDVPPGEKDKVYQNFITQYGATGYGPLATFWQASSLEKRAQYREAAALLDAQTHPNKKGFLIRGHTWQTLRDLALVRGGYLLIMARVPHQEVKDYLRSVSVKGRFHEQALALQALSAYGAQQFSDARTLIAQMSKDIDGKNVDNIIGSLLELALNGSDS